MSEDLVKRLRGSHNRNWDGEEAADEIERLRAALGKIAAIENNDWGGDWEEIDQAREIARAVLAKGEP